MRLNKSRNKSKHNRTSRTQRRSRHKRNRSRSRGGTHKLSDISTYITPYMNKQHVCNIKSVNRRTANIPHECNITINASEKCNDEFNLIRSRSLNRSKTRRKFLNTLSPRRMELFNGPEHGLCIQTENGDYIPGVCDGIGGYCMCSSQSDNISNRKDWKNMAPFLERIVANKRKAVGLI